MGDGFAAEFAELRSGRLKEFAIHGDAENARDGEATFVAVVVRKAGDPTPHDAASIGNEHGVGGIEIGAEIDLAAAGGLETARVGIEVANVVLDGAIGGTEENIFVADVKKVGTFGGAGAGIGQLEHDATVFPLGEAGVEGLINVGDRLAAFGFVEVTASDEESFVVGMENEGVAPFVDFAVAMKSLGKDGILGAFLPLDEVLIANGRPLFGVGLGRFLGDAGVENHGLAVAVDRAGARPDAGFALLASWRESNGKRFPMGEIATADVTPIFRAAAIGIEGVELVKEMVITAIEDWAVGIVDPIAGRGDVKDGMAGIGLRARGSGGKSGFGALQGGGVRLSAGGEAKEKEA